MKTAMAETTMLTINPLNPKGRCHGLPVYAVSVCNKVRLPGTGQSAHVIGGSRFTRPASITVYKSTNFDYLRTSFKANVKLVVRKRNV